MSESLLDRDRPTEPSGGVLGRPLDGRGAVVTGASKGIGRAVTLTLATAGANVVATGRDVGALRLLEVEAARSDALVQAHAAELTEELARQRLAETAHDLLGGVSILVHSAGVYRRGSLAGAALADLDRQYEVNLRAPYALTQLLLEDLSRSCGDVVFVNSTQGLTAAPEVGQYAATKHALRAVADSLRGELGPTGPRVCTILPGRTATPMQRRIFAEEGRAWSTDALMAPEDVAAMVLAVVSLPTSAEVSDVVMRPAAATRTMR